MLLAKKTLKPSREIGRYGIDISIDQCYTWWPNTMNTRSDYMSKIMPSEELEASFRRSLNDYADYVYNWAVHSGLWEGYRSHGRRTMSENALMHQHVSRAFEALRRVHRQGDSLPMFSAAEEAFADLIISVLGFASHRSLDLGSAVVAKMKLNEMRQHTRGTKIPE